MASSKWPTPKSPSDAPLGVTQKPTSTTLSPRNISPRKCAAKFSTATARKSSTKAACRCAPRSTPSMQVLARKVLTDGLVQFRRERKAGADRSPRSISSGDWGVKLADVKALTDIAPWRLAVVLETGDQSARIGLQPGREPGGYVSKERDVGILPLEGMKWARDRRQGRSRKVSQVLNPGDVVYVEPANLAGPISACIRCRKSPAPWWSRIPGPAACSPWSAVSPTTRASSIARRRRCASPAPPSSRSSMPRRSTTAIRRRRLILDAPIEIDQGPGLGRLEAGELREQFLRSLDACASASSIRAT